MRGAPLAAQLSFRLGGTDGVSIEAGKWQTALEALGFRVRRIAGEILDDGRGTDVVVPELAIDAHGEPPPDAVEAAIDGASLVIVENLVSLPLNLPAARVVTKMILRFPRVVLRHHDLPWQRDAFVDVRDLPPPLTEALHVTINDRSRRDLAARGIRAVTIQNHFDFDRTPGDREGTRRKLRLGRSDLLVLHPVRAIRRKNVPAALRFAEALAGETPGRRVVYWLPGPAEEGYAEELERLVASAAVDVERRDDLPMDDAYAACDVVVFPSTWEGFGNPVIESVAARRPLAVARYPVLDELLHLGLEFFRDDEPARVAAALRDPSSLGEMLDRNVAIAREHLSVALLPQRVEAAMREMGWAVP